MVRRQPLKATRPQPLDLLSHELNAMIVVLDIWHHEVPPPVRRNLRQRLATIERVIRRMRRSSQCDSARGSGAHLEKS